MKQKLKNKIELFFWPAYLIRYNRKVEEKIADIDRLSKQDKSEYPKNLAEIYQQKMGYPLNLDNPKAYTEKIQWLKIFDATQEKADWTDKVLAKEKAAERIGEEHVIPLLGQWKSFDEIDFSSLPDKFVLKANHGSGCNYVVTDKKKFLRSGRYHIARARFNAWLRMDYGFDDAYELHYSLIKNRRVLAEKYIDPNEEPMLEYRFYCFDGKPEYIATRKLDDDLISCEDLYDTEWNKLDAILGCGNPHHTREEKPEELEEMLNLSRKLSEGFKFVRVDMNLTPKHIYFGENTFTDGSGMYEIIPKEFDYEMGTKLILPTDK